MVHPLRLALACALSAVPAASQGCPPQFVAQVTASDIGLGDNFGYSVDVSGDTAVLGANYHGHQGGKSGAAYVYVNDPLAGWTEVQELLASDGNAGDRLGAGVAIDGDTIVLGAPWDDVGFNRTGSAYVFERGPGGSFAEAVKLTAYDPQTDDFYGTAVEVRNDTVVIGADQEDPGASEAGSVYVYGRDVGGPGAWGLVKKVVASDPGANQHFGTSLSLDGDTLAVGASGSFGLGAAYLFERDLGGADAWGQAAKLVPADIQLWDLVGASIALWGDLVVVGAPGKDGAAKDSGACYAFERDHGGPGAWGEAMKLTGDDWPNESFGHSVALHGSTALIAGRPDAQAGIYVMVHQGVGNWTEAARENVPTWYLSSTTIAISSLTGVVGGTTLGGKANFYQVVAQMPPTVYCTAGVSGAGCTPLLTAQGTASATAPSGFDVVVSSAEGGRSGLFFFGTNGRQAAPWNSGFQCVVPPVRRGQTLTSGGTLGQCDGSYLYDLNARWTAVPAQRPALGDLVQIQLWMRDPNSPGPQTTMFSNALETPVCP